MKTLIVSLILALSFNANATEFMGGVVKSAEGKMAFACESKDENNKCQEIRVLFDWGNGFEEINRFHRADQRELGNEATSEAREDLNDAYVGAAFAGTAVGVAAMWYSNNPVAVPLFVVGVAADIAKAPLVGLAWIGHKISDAFAKRRIRKLVGFMLDEKKVGKTKRTRKRYLRAIRGGFYDL